ncbi:MAG: DUF1289 domain-containing protein [Roseinatronobacter sp.]
MRYIKGNHTIRTEHMDSPCINICVIDPSSRLCKGCLRTIDEITTWSRLSDAQRRSLMAELPSRAPRISPQMSPQISQGKSLC